MKWFKKKTKTAAPVSEQALPRHVAVIMDGNGRWAKKRGLPRQAGHVAGARIIRRMVNHCEEYGIKVVTLYAFSTENWKRPKEEVDALMGLMRQYLNDTLPDFRKGNMQVHILGDKSHLPEDVRLLMEETERETAHKTGMILNMAVNYGGRDELVHAVRALAQKAKDGEISPEEITEETVSAHLYTAGQPDPDMILRPSGEHRLSNFLIWQAAYAEYVFMDDILWPDFTEKDMDAALAEYAKRNRRFGGV